MKKVFAIVLGASAMIACTKTSVSYEPTGEIALAPVARVNMTKAAVEGVKMPEDWGLKVFGYYDQNETAIPEAGIGDKFSTVYLNGALFAKKGDVWAGSPTPYYWPKTGSILFAAYAPADFTPALTHDRATNVFTLTDYVQPALKDTKDLLYSCYTTPAKNGTVPMTFRHALAWVTFELGTGDDDVFAVKKITIENAASKGSATLGTATDGNDNRKWTVSEKKNLQIFAGDKKLTTAVEIADAEKCGLVIPAELGDDVVLKIEYTMAYGATAPVAQVFSKQLNLCEAANNQKINEWKAGMHYTYRLNFGREEITITPKVEDWDDTDIDNIDLGK